MGVFVLATTKFESLYKYNFVKMRTLFADMLSCLDICRFPLIRNTSIAGGFRSLCEALFCISYARHGGVYSLFLFFYPSSSFAFLSWGTSILHIFWDTRRKRLFPRRQQDWCQPNRKSVASFHWTNNTVKYYTQRDWTNFSILSLYSTKITLKSIFEELLVNISRFLLLHICR